MMSFIKQTITNQEMPTFSMPYSMYLGTAIPSFNPYIIRTTVQFLPYFSVVLR